MQDSRNDLNLPSSLPVIILGIPWQDRVINTEVLEGAGHIACTSYCASDAYDGLDMSTKWKMAVSPRTYYTVSLPQVLDQLVIHYCVIRMSARGT